MAVVALAVGSAGLLACTDESAVPVDGAASGDGAAAGDARSVDADRPIDYVAADAAVFRQQVVIDGWNERPGGPDVDSIDGHAWDLWRAINAPTGQELNGTSLPVWETWYSDAEVFLDNQEVDEATSRDLDPLNQSLHAGSLSTTAQAAQTRSTTGAATAGVLSFNRFNREILDSVQQNQLHDRAALLALDDDFDLAGIGAGGRSIPQLPNTSVMLKPVWWIIPGDEPSMIPYWAGGNEPHTTDPHTTDPANPSWQTWRQCVLVDPTRTLDELDDEVRGELTGTERACNAGQPGETTVAGGDYEVRSVDVDPARSDLYAFRLTEDEVDGLGQFKMMLDNTNREDHLDEVEVGDVAVLVAMHVATREVPRWTWQTFWWTPTPSAPAELPPSARVAPRDITGPWAQFNMCSSYSMTVPTADGGREDLVCFNPYLETDLTGLFSADGTRDDLVGRDSNCMSCHRAATFHASAPTRYVASGEVADADPTWFSDGLQIEFMWSIAFHAHDGPFIGPLERTATPPPG